MDEERLSPSADEGADDGLAEDAPPPSHRWKRRALVAGAALAAGLLGTAGVEGALGLVSIRTVELASHRSLSGEDSSKKDDDKGSKPKQP